ncbi:uncharacterized protein N7498_006276 [Penicillium cinerascens]|uniref:Uncharacterized protein n=1 Tax=Penicillium cinerascens TaxID=70096 RepID=A0A9W9MHX9_9EURO|nr:uncharacterized protein N7498_006276 [Penicillium cinerascens]KAJ5201613.1 hypothetical protein N7498_006276 [Penicillium cinerascens]
MARHMQDTDIAGRYLEMVNGFEQKRHKGFVIVEDISQKVRVVSLDISSEVFKNRNSTLSMVVRKFHKATEQKRIWKQTRL